MLEFNIDAPFLLHGRKMLPFGYKSKLQVNLGDLQNQAENLASFLKERLNANVTTNSNKLTVTIDDLSPQKLLQAVTKFIYHRNLNTTYWAH
jgi:hypothetical protein